MRITLLEKIELEFVLAYFRNYLHFNKHVRLHEARCCHEEGGVGDSSRSGDNLSATAMDRLVGDYRVQDFELAIPDGLFA